MDMPIYMDYFRCSKINLAAGNFETLRILPGTY